MNDELLKFAQKKLDATPSSTTITLVIHGCPSEIAYGLLIDSLETGKPISREEVMTKTNH